MLHRMSRFSFVVVNINYMPACSIGWCHLGYRLCCRNACALYFTSGDQISMPRCKIRSTVKATFAVSQGRICCTW